MEKVSLRYLSQEEVIRLNLDFMEVIDEVEKAFVAHGNKQYELPPKPGVHTRPSSFIHAMPAWLSDRDICGIKWVSGYPENNAIDLPHIAGLFILNESATGMPLCVMDCRYLTALRTAAVTAITAKYCASSNAKTLTVIGTGEQGTFNALMLKEVIPDLETIYAADLREEAVKEFSEVVSQKINVNVVKVKNLEEAIRSSDLIVTAGVMKPLIPYDWLKPGVCCLPLEAARAWYKDVILNIDKFITDDWGQTQYWIQNSEGAFAAKPSLYSELGKIVIGEKPGRQNDNEKILAVNIGLAIGDVSLGNAIFNKAVEKNIGTILPFMENSKLF